MLSAVTAGAPTNSTPRWKIGTTSDTQTHVFEKKKMAQMSFVSADKFRFLMNSPYGTLSLSLSLYRSDEVVCPFEAHVAAAGEDS